MAQSIAQFRKICEQHNVPYRQISLFATEAVRTAYNSHEMIEAIRIASGLHLQILSAGMESLLGACGARASMEFVDSLVSELGGGSIQLLNLTLNDASHNEKAAKAAISMPFGAAKVTNVLITQNQSSKIEQELQNTMKASFDSLQSQSQRLREQAASSDGVDAYLLGGGWRAAGYVLMHLHPVQPYPILEIGGFVTSGAELAQTAMMLEANATEGKIFGMSKRRRAQFPAIALVMTALVKAVPRINKVVFCAGGNREGVLYLKLPPLVQERNPLRVLSEDVGFESGASVDEIVNLFSKCLPDACPAVFDADLLRYVVCNIWKHLGISDDANSATALQNPISGSLSHFSCLTHEVKAIIALTMCARWGTNLAPTHKTLFNNLRRLVGDTVSFVSDYLGTLARLLALVSPTCPASPDLLMKTIS